MRGSKDGSAQLFFRVDIEELIRGDHPLRFIKTTVDNILADMDHVFAGAYSSMGRPSVPPERVLKALLLMVLYTVRSERQLVERIHTNMLFRWFLDLSIECSTLQFLPITVNE